MLPHVLPKVVTSTPTPTTASRGSAVRDSSTSPRPRDESSADPVPPRTPVDPQSTTFNDDTDGDFDLRDALPMGLIAQTTTIVVPPPSLLSRLVRSPLFVALPILLGLVSVLIAGPNVLDLPRDPPASLAAMYDAIGDIDVSSFFQFQGGMAPNLTEMFGSWFVNPVGGHAQDGWEEFLPGLELAQEENLTAKHPVVIMPGITSTHLEVWNSKSVTDKVSCGLKYFRRRLWGTLNQIRAILLDKACWFEHMSLDPKTGLDPPGIKLRAAQGLDAADYLFPGYYVLARIIANLATIGYDNNNSSCFPKQHMASYDWRLSYTNLEARDQYFTKLKMTIETAYRSNMKPHTPHGHEEDHSRVVVISHSMGSLIFHYFLQWVESDLGGKGGRGWVDKHLKTWVNIAGPTLGSPKTVPSVVSGELRDIVNLNTYASYVLEQLFSRREVRFLFRNWGGLSSLAPKGGETIWGSAGEDAPDDLDGTGKFSTIMEIVGKRIEERPSTTLFPIPGGASSTPVVPQDDGTGDAAAGGAEKAGDGVGTDGVGVSRNVTAGGLKSFLDGVVPEYSDRWDAEYATHIATTWSEIQAAPQLPRNWVNPLLCPLPRVKDRKEEGKKFKIVCEYGVGIPTERKYFFADYGGPDASERYFIHQQHQEPGLVENGVLLTDGDATVALISLGYMCAEGWRRKRYNPSNVPVIVREHLETASTSMKGGGIQGGPGSANHVDIMGNHAVIEDILRIASGIDELEDRYHSRIREIAARVKLPEMYYDARWPDASPAKN